MDERMEPPVLYVTDITTNFGQLDAIYCPDPDAPGFRMVGGVRGYASVDLSMTMSLTPGADAILKSIARNNGRLTFGVERREYRCLYCGVANPIDNRWCDRCGGPRGWIL